MNTLGWLLDRFALEEVIVPSALVDPLAMDEQPLDAWLFLNEGSSAANKRNLDRLYPARNVLPFARRGDQDDVACLVLQGAQRPNGHVLVIHDGATPGHEVVGVFPSLGAWFDHAQEQAMAS